MRSLHSSLMVILCLYGSGKYTGFFLINSYIFRLLLLPV